MVQDRDVCFPLCYSFSLESFLSTICHNSNIQGIKVGPYEHKYVAFADDILFYVQQPTTTIPNLMSAFESFWSISHFKIINILLPVKDVPHLKPSFPFSWQPCTLNNLGILLTPQTSNLFWANYIPLLNFIRQDLYQWNHLTNSWLGRISIVKINILPRVLFLFQMIQYKLPPVFFSALTSLVLDYVWHHKHPRISQAILTRLKSDGGLAVPGLKKYYLAIILKRISDWKRIQTLGTTWTWPRWLRVVLTTLNSWGVSLSHWRYIPFDVHCHNLGLPT